jgi:hypothetical protein
VAVILTPGQAGDNPQLEPLLDLHHQQYPLPTNPVSGCWPTRPIRTRRPERSCGAGESRTRSRNDRTSRTGARPRAPRVAGHPASTSRPTPNATPSNVATYASSSGEASPHGTTNTP